MNRRILVLGATGMLGHTLMRELHDAPGVEVHGTARSSAGLPPTVAARVSTGIDVLAHGRMGRLLDQVAPDVVVNCVGVIKQRPEVQNAVHTVTVNALFPHQLAEECVQRGVRLVHVSTDCVFSGDRGGYVETDIPDPPDLYGRSKLLGEVDRAPALTLRTSIIGHELSGHRSLVDWFLSQRGVVSGYTKAIYSGITTVEFARLLRSVVLPREDLTGLYHVAATPISKYELLKLIADTYGWTGDVVQHDAFVCDRSMNADALAQVTGYRPPSWPEMIYRLAEARVRWTRNGFVSVSREATTRRLSSNGPPGMATAPLSRS
ncbi:dTDP-4-dehydrorhamnose reductase family protein [Micromonospora sediminimaris]|uniref:dTDP-4-dehydrorhamnose reductase n=1 Tax=Micromonospora sediminimaris TaxID=547162 RepID=A0A9W5XL81_9ACTN|nr:SDR family oxidoreductase [Micromonospora sediminimaris]GIJ33483.1 NAD(P)-dependent oxidoreductase [Micromonospora sediminimaris]SFC92443.1 dTDP-4-dehydrorhamnose reductase [Micromonospora sediminimaris]